MRLRGVKEFLYMCVSFFANTSEVMRITPENVITPSLLDEPWHIGNHKIGRIRVVNYIRV